MSVGAASARAVSAAKSASARIGVRTEVATLRTGRSCASRRYRWGIAALSWISLAGALAALLALDLFFAHRSAATLRAAPGHGADTDEVLLEAGLTWDDLLRLKVAGAIT